MSKEIKILLVLLLVALFLVFYLIVRSKPLSREIVPIASQPQKVDLEQLERDYRKEVKIIFSDYLALIERGEFQKEEVRDIRDRLLSLKVPVQFKDLHLNLVLAVSRMEKSLVEGNNEDKMVSQEVINELKGNYVWLN